MTPASQLQGLEARIIALESAFTADQAQARGTSRAATCVTAAICLTVAAFTVINYVNLRSNWAHADVAKSIEQEVAEISPALQTELRELAQKLLPVYSHEGRTQLLAFGPQVASQLKQEFDLLGADVLGLVNNELDGLQSRVSSRSQDIVMVAYPSLTDASRRQKFETEVHAITSTALINVFTTFQERFDKDIKDIETCLLDFDLSDSGEDTTDLQKKFIHLWLRVLDQELSEL